MEFHLSLEEGDLAVECSSAWQNCSHGASSKSGATEDPRGTRRLQEVPGGRSTLGTMKGNSYIQVSGDLTAGISSVYSQSLIESNGNPTP